MLFICMSECPWGASARQVFLSALRRTIGVKQKIHIALTKSRILAQLPLHLLVASLLLLSSLGGGKVILIQ